MAAAQGAGEKGRPGGEREGCRAAQVRAKCGLDFEGSAELLKGSRQGIAPSAPNALPTIRVFPVLF